MIESFSVSNFRGFKSVDLANLPRFNVLIGESGSGKTAFLEAAWIAGGVSPEIYFRMRALRGMAEQNFQLSGEKLSYETFFSDIFHDPTSPSAHIQFMDNHRGSRSLKIDYDPSQQMVLSIPSKPPTIASDGTKRDLVFHWVINEHEHVCPLKVNAAGQIVVENPPEPFPAVMFSSSFIASGRENAERLSISRISGEKKKIVETIAKIFPDIEDLSSESVANQQMIWAAMKGLRRMIPLSVVSSGVNKFISLLLWISLNRNGVLLLDEIENGFYFMNYEVIFKTIVEFCDTYGVQLFAATHSLEFLNAVAKVMESRQGDLSMLRTSYKHGECFIKQIEGTSSIEALKQGIEIRL
jgi:predicted ATPase